MSPARRRSNENSAAKQQRETAPKKSKKRKPKPKGPRSLPDPSDTADSEVRFIQPYSANKVYLCPGCLRDIPTRLGHVVAVPLDAPDLRRHWHRACWDSRASHR